MVDLKIFNDNNNNVLLLCILHKKHLCKISMSLKGKLDITDRNFASDNIICTWYIDLLMVQWVVRSVPHGGPIELFLVPASASQLVSSQLDGAYKRSLAAN